jgi:hypothetical protein
LFIFKQLPPVLFFFFGGGGGFWGLNPEPGAG